MEQINPLIEKIILLGSAIADADNMQVTNTRKFLLISNILSMLGFLPKASIIEVQKKIEDLSLHMCKQDIPSILKRSLSRLLCEFFRLGDLNRIFPFINLLMKEVTMGVADNNKAAQLFLLSDLLAFECVTLNHVFSDVSVAIKLHVRHADPAIRENALRVSAKIINACGVQSQIGQLDVWKNIIYRPLQSDRCSEVRIGAAKCLFELARCELTESKSMDVIRQCQDSMLGTCLKLVCDPFSVFTGSWAVQGMNSILNAFVAVLLRLVMSESAGVESSKKNASVTNSNRIIRISKKKEHFKRIVSATFSAGSAGYSSAISGQVIVDFSSAVSWLRYQSRRLSENKNAVDSLVSVLVRFVLSYVQLLEDEEDVTSLMVFSIQYLLEDLVDGEIPPIVVTKAIFRLIEECNGSAQTISVLRSVFFSTIPVGDNGALHVQDLTVKNLHVLLTLIPMIASNQVSVGSSSPLSELFSFQEIFFLRVNDAHCTDLLYEAIESLTTIMTGESLELLLSHVQRTGEGRYGYDFSVESITRLVHLGNSLFNKLENKEKVIGLFVDLLHEFNDPFDSLSADVGEPEESKSPGVADKDHLRLACAMIIIDFLMKSTCIELVGTRLTLFFSFWRKSLGKKFLSGSMGDVPIIGLSSEEDDVTSTILTIVSFGVKSITGFVNLFKQTRLLSPNSSQPKLPRLVCLLLSNALQWCCNSLSSTSRFERFKRELLNLREIIFSGLYYMHSDILADCTVHTLSSTGSSVSTLGTFAAETREFGIGTYSIRCAVEAYNDFLGSDYVFKHIMRKEDDYDHLIGEYMALVCETSSPFASTSNLDGLSIGLRTGIQLELLCCNGKYISAGDIPTQDFFNSSLCSGHVLCVLKNDKDVIDSPWSSKLIVRLIMMGVSESYNVVKESLDSFISVFYRYSSLKEKERGVSLQMGIKCGYMLYAIINEMVKRSREKGDNDFSSLVNVIVDHLLKIFKPAMEFENPIIRLFYYRILGTSYPLLTQSSREALMIGIHECISVGSSGGGTIRIRSACACFCGTLFLSCPEAINEGCPIVFKLGKDTDSTVRTGVLWAFSVAIRVCGGLFAPWLKEALRLIYAHAFADAFDNPVVLYLLSDILLSIRQTSTLEVASTDKLIFNSMIHCMTDLTKRRTFATEGFDMISLLIQRNHSRLASISIPLVGDEDGFSSREIAWEMILSTRFDTLFSSEAALLCGQLDNFLCFACSRGSYVAKNLSQGLLKLIIMGMKYEHCQQQVKRITRSLLKNSITEDNMETLCSTLSLLVEVFKSKNLKLLDGIEVSWTKNYEESSSGDDNKGNVDVDDEADDTYERRYSTAGMNTNYVNKKIHKESMSSTIHLNAFGKYLLLKCIKQIAKLLRTNENDVAPQLSLVTALIPSLLEISSSCLDSNSIVLLKEQAIKVVREIVSLFGGYDRGLVEKGVHCDIHPENSLLLDYDTQFCTILRKSFRTDNVLVDAGLSSRMLMAATRVTEQVLSLGLTYNSLRIYEFVSSMISCLFTQEKVKYLLDTSKFTTCFGELLYVFFCKDKNDNRVKYVKRISEAVLNFAVEVIMSIHKDFSSLENRLVNENISSIEINTIFKWKDFTALSKDSSIVIKSLIFILSNCVADGYDANGSLMNQCEITLTELVFACLHLRIESGEVISSCLVSLPLILNGFAGEHILHLFYAFVSEDKISHRLTEGQLYYLLEVLTRNFSSAEASETSTTLLCLSFKLLVLSLVDYSVFSISRLTTIRMLVREKYFDDNPVNGTFSFLVWKCIGLSLRNDIPDLIQEWRLLCIDCLSYSNSCFHMILDDLNERMVSKNSSDSDVALSLLLLSELNNVDVKDAIIARRIAESFCYCFINTESAWLRDKLDIVIRASFDKHQENDLSNYLAILPCSLLLIKPRYDILLTFISKHTPQNDESRKEYFEFISSILQVCPHQFKEEMKTILMRSESLWNYVKLRIDWLNEISGDIPEEARSSASIAISQEAGSQEKDDVNSGGHSIELKLTF